MKRFIVLLPMLLTLCACGKEEQKAIIEPSKNVTEPREEVKEKAVVEPLITEDYICVINNVPYNLYTDFAEFADNGWTCADETLVPSGQRYETTMQHTDGYEAYIECFNPNYEKDAPVSECWVVTVEVGSAIPYTSIGTQVVGEHFDESYTPLPDFTHRTYELDSEGVLVGFSVSDVASLYGEGGAGVDWSSNPEFSVNDLTFTIPCNTSTFDLYSVQEDGTCTIDGLTLYSNEEEVKGLSFNWSISGQETTCSFMGTDLLEFCTTPENFFGNWYFNYYTINRASEDSTQIATYTEVLSWNRNGVTATITSDNDCSGTFTLMVDSAKHQVN